MLTANPITNGEVAEWFMAHAWKACLREIVSGFESPSLRSVDFAKKYNITILTIKNEITIFNPCDYRFNVFGRKSKYLRGSEEMENESATVEQVAPAEEAPATEAPAEVTEEAAAEPTFHQILKQRFIEGGPFFMGIVLVALILGLAIAIERIIYLNMATTNTKKLVAKVDDALQSGGVDAASEVCRNTKGPVASIFLQGLLREQMKV